MFEEMTSSPEKENRQIQTESPGIRRRKKTTDEQYKELETIFQKTEKPNSNLRKELGTKLGMTSRCVQVWFQNRRAKKKKEAGEYPQNIKKKKRRKQTDALFTESELLAVVDTSSLKQEDKREPALDLRLVEELHSIMFGNGSERKEGEDKLADLFEKKKKKDRGQRIEENKGINKILSNILQRKQETTPINKFERFKNTTNLQTEEDPYEKITENLFPVFPSMPGEVDHETEGKCSESSPGLFSTDLGLYTNIDKLIHGKENNFHSQNQKT